MKLRSAGLLFAVHLCSVLLLNSATLSAATSTPSKQTTTTKKAVVSTPKAVSTKKGTPNKTTNKGDKRSCSKDKKDGGRHSQSHHDKCVVGKWSEWVCGAKCGDGRLVRSRKVQPAGCAKSVEYGKPCHRKPCSVDCVVGEWKQWSACTKTCGGGKQLRTRDVVVPPSGNGRRCPLLVDTRPCNTQSCDVDCVWHWSDWTACSQSCGGTQVRTVVVDVQPVGNGEPCPTSPETQACLVDCQLSAWSDWTVCNDDSSWSAWGGFCTSAPPRARTRTIQKVAYDGGQACPTADEMTELTECDITCCPNTCMIGQWTEWAACCPGQTTVRTRAVCPKGCTSEYDTQMCNA